MTLAIPMGQFPKCRCFSKEQIFFYPVYSLGFCRENTPWFTKNPQSEAFGAIPTPGQLLIGLPEGLGGKHWFSQMLHMAVWL